LLIGDVLDLFVKVHRQLCRNNGSEWYRCWLLRCAWPPGPHWPDLRATARIAPRQWGYLSFFRFRSHRGWCAARAQKCFPARGRG
jgi:hypothetical protein